MHEILDLSLSLQMQSADLMKKEASLIVVVQCKTRFSSMAELDLLLVSLKIRGSHFCAAAILSNHWLLTAAHCFAGVSKDYLHKIEAVAGEFHQRKNREMGEKLPSGWGRIFERGPLSSVLQEVQLDLLEQSKCKYMLQTLRPGQKTFTVLWGFRESFALPKTRWTLGGSRGNIMGRAWSNNKFKHSSRRGSPGVFTDVSMFLDWIKSNLRKGGQVAM
ncbi:hypothetical protein DNTS_013250 [Danionella cerebrum]|uniref:Peptidase S1 domain-containing protein n=1 Tax=Danionella cerebrum TaxID=2873325 RepID=A0A553Q730_9TELE|nr:hypothetical protein DNTS_013250 [Danionella translucida]